MKRILVIHSNMELGGAETSLLGLLQSVDYNKYRVDLLLLNPVGILLPLIPKEVNVLNTPKKYRHLMYPIKDVVKSGDFGIAYARLLGKWRGKKIGAGGYAIKQYAHLAAVKYLPSIGETYDLALSFIDPHYILLRKVKAKVKIGWVHFQFRNARMEEQLDKAMWEELSCIACVSDSCRQQFIEHYPELTNKTLVIENVLSKNYIQAMAEKIDVSNEINGGGFVKLLSIGRYVQAKNFDNVPIICEKLVKQGLNVRWYIIGFGSKEGEDLIRKRIADSGVENHVILLGKKENPYPYIKASDIYVQPSRWEGKSVAVREAQILGKPVVITAYPTSSSQLTDGYDGVVVPMDNEGCANGIAAVINNKDLQAQLVRNVSSNDYTNSKELQKLYNLMEQ